MKTKKSVVLTVDEQLGRIHLTCKSDLKSSELRECLMPVLNFASSHQIKQWLFDFSAIGCLSELDETWLQTHFFPRLMMAMGSNNYVALVLSEQCHRTLLQEVGESGMQTYNSFVILHTFGCLADAVVWLNNERMSKAS